MHQFNLFLQWNILTYRNRLLSIYMCVCLCMCLCVYVCKSAFYFLQIIVLPRRFPHTPKVTNSSKSSAGDLKKLKKNISFQNGELVDFWTRVCFTWFWQFIRAIGLMLVPCNWRAQMTFIRTYKNSSNRNKSTIT